jgi:hypothetical protein
MTERDMAKARFYIAKANEALNANEFHQSLQWVKKLDEVFKDEKSLMYLSISIMSRARIHKKAMQYAAQMEE